MSALSPHIRSHRAMAQALEAVSILSKDALVGGILGGLSRAHSIAADSLEEHQRELDARVIPIPAPKGH